MVDGFPDHEILASSHAAAELFCDDNEYTGMEVKRFNLTRVMDVRRRLLVPLRRKFPALANYANDMDIDIAGDEDLDSNERRGREGQDGGSSRCRGSCASKGCSAKSKGATRGD